MKISNKLLLFDLLQATRNFFLNDAFIDVMTPPIVSNPGMETHIHPFQVGRAINKELLPLYLHTSPEFHMKQLLSDGLEKIFTLTYSFRDEPNSETHRPQFIMLEWYRAHERYEKIMDDTIELFAFCCEYLKSKGHKIAQGYESFTPTKMTVSEIVKKYCGFEILDYLEKEDLYNLIIEKYKDITLGPIKEYSWDDLFFLFFLNKVEPHFKEIPFLLLYEFPHHLSALSTLKDSDNRVCERFEVYCHGVELCNCFNELTDIEEQKRRFKNQAKEKEELYQYSLPEATLLFNALERGLPRASGIALGVERMLKVILGLENPFYD